MTCMPRVPTAAQHRREVTPWVSMGTAATAGSADGLHCFLPQQVRGSRARAPVARPWLAQGQGRCRPQGSRQGGAGQGIAGQRSAGRPTCPTMCLYGSSSSRRFRWAMWPTVSKELGTSMPSGSRRCSRGRGPGVGGRGRGQVGVPDTCCGVGCEPSSVHTRGRRLPSFCLLARPHDTSAHAQMQRQHQLRQQRSTPAGRRVRTSRHSPHPPEP
jgi:hypothetical protein